MLVRSTTNTRPTTLAQFRKMAEAGFREANPDALNIRITWVESSRVSKWADGSAGFWGRFTVTADGHENRFMHATWCHGLLVR